MSSFDPDQPPVRSQHPNADPRRPRVIINGLEPDMDQFQPVIRARQRRSPIGCLFGFVMTLVIIGSIGIAVYAILTSFGVSLGPISTLITSVMGGPETRPVSGDASRFDPIASLADVKTFAGEGVQFASLRASNVRSDGTLDLKATYTPAPYVEYQFLREIPRPENAPPVGAGGTTAGPWYEPVEINVFQPGARRRQTTSGGGVRTTIDYVNQGMTRSVDSPTTSPFDLPAPDPVCSFADLWRVALTKDAPPDAVAIIEYSNDGYDFTISGIVSLRFNMECELED